MNILPDGSFMPYGFTRHATYAANTYTQIHTDCLEQDANYPPDIDTGHLAYLWAVNLMRAVGDRTADPELRCMLMAQLRRGFQVAIDHPIQDDGLLVELED